MGMWCCEQCGAPLPLILVAPHSCGKCGGSGVLLICSPWQGEMRLYPQGTSRIDQLLAEAVADVRRNAEMRKVKP